MTKLPTVRSWSRTLRGSGGPATTYYYLNCCVFVQYLTVFQAVVEAFHTSDEFLDPPLLPNLELSLGTRDTKHILAVVAGLISYTPLDRRIKVPHFERQLCYSRALKSIVTWSCPHFWVWSVPNAKNYRRPPSLLRRLSSARAIYTMVPQLVAIEANPRLP